MPVASTRCDLLVHPALLKEKFAGYYYFEVFRGLPFVSAPPPPPPIPLKVCANKIVTWVNLYVRLLASLSSTLFHTLPELV